jgi:hypothetical protein
MHISQATLSCYFKLSERMIYPFLAVKAHWIECRIPSLRVRHSGLAALLIRALLNGGDHRHGIVPVRYIYGGD